MQKVLSLCARDSGHEAMYAELTRACSAFPSQETSWEQIIHNAEQHGVASLLYKHIREVDVNIPKDARRLLQSLYLRNRRSNRSRNKAVIEIVNAYRLEGIDVLLVKGIALCNFVYSEIGLRPMRDLDLLVKKSDLEKAEKILLDLGYTKAQKHAIPADYYHLVPMEKIIDGLPVGIELHHNLLPFHPQYPLWPLEKSYSTARKFEINGVMARTLSLEDTLLYVYLHGFQAPLTYEPYRLMHVADIVSLVEKYFESLNWQQIRQETPTLLNSISRFHYLTPWSESLSMALGLDIRNQPWGAGLPFSGWPLQKLRTVKTTRIPVLLKNTILPSQWWLQVYYGHLQGLAYWKARCIDHPRTVWRWIKTYCLANYNRGKKNNAS